MNLWSVLHPDSIITGMAGMAREECIRSLLTRLSSGRKLDVEDACRDIMKREQLGATLLPGERYVTAIPHASTGACKQLMVGIGLSPEGVAWGASDHRAQVVALIVGPPQTRSLHLQMLSRIARLCRQSELVSRILKLTDPAEVIAALREAEDPLGDLRASEDLPSFCVLGAGHGGLAMAGHLALTGCRVNLYNRSAEHIQAVRARSGIELVGEVEGFAELDRVTTDVAEAIENVDILMVVVPATAHRAIAEAVCPHIRDGQILVLNPGRTGGALEVAQVFRQNNLHAHPYIAEAQTLLVAARVIDPGQVRIFGIKNSVPVAALPSYFGPDILPILRKALPQFIAGDDVLKTSLDNIGAVFHPAITILNAGRIEDTHGGFEYYIQGVTPSVARVLEAVDRERIELAEALGLHVHSAREWLYFAYDAAGRSLYDAVRANRGYTGIKAPGTVDHRYIAEDVPASLVPIVSLAEMLGVQTPVMRSLIHLGSVMHGVDYWAIGRTVDKLGLAGMSVKEIRQMIAGIESAPRQPETG